MHDVHVHASVSICVWIDSLLFVMASWAVSQMKRNQQKGCQVEAVAVAVVERERNQNQQKEEQKHYCLLLLLL